MAYRQSVVEQAMLDIFERLSLSSEYKTSMCGLVCACVCARGKSICM